MADDVAGIADHRGADAPLARPHCACWRQLWDWLGLLVLPATVTVLIGLDWQWTGFPGNTLWDWLHLLLVPFVLPIAVAWFSVRLDPATQNGPERTVAVSPDAPAEAG